MPPIHADGQGKSGELLLRSRVSAYVILKERINQ